MVPTLHAAARHGYSPAVRRAIMRRTLEGLIGAGLALIAVAAPAARATPPGDSASQELTVTLAPGWTDGEEAALDRLIHIVYPIVESVTGEPAESRVVVIRRDAEGGTCIADDGIAVTRAVPLDLSVASCVTHELIHSFHDRTGLSTAIEEGATVAATTEVLMRAGAALGLPAPPTEPTTFVLNGVWLSATAAADGLDGPSLAVQPWRTDAGGRPAGVNDLYASAAAFWMTLVAERPTVIRDFYAAWDARHATDEADPFAILRALVPTVGGIAFDDWRLGGWWVLRDRHGPGLYLRCADYAPQLDRVAGIEHPVRFFGLIRVVETGTDGLDRYASGDMTLTVRDAAGHEIGSTHVVVDGSEDLDLDETLPAPPGPGAYRLTVALDEGRGARVAGTCWLTAGIRTFGRAVLVGAPRTSARVVYRPSGSTPDAPLVTGSVRIGPNGTATVASVASGLVIVRAPGMSDKALPVGSRGALVAITTP